MLDCGDILAETHKEQFPSARPMGDYTEKWHNCGLDATIYLGLHFPNISSLIPVSSLLYR